MKTALRLLLALSLGLMAPGWEAVAAVRANSPKSGPSQVKPGGTAPISVSLPQLPASLVLQTDRPPIVEVKPLESVGAQRGQSAASQEQTLEALRSAGARLDSKEDPPEKVVASLFDGTQAAKKPEKGAAAVSGEAPAALEPGAQQGPALSAKQVSEKIPRGLGFSGMVELGGIALSLNLLAGLGSALTRGWATYPFLLAFAWYGFSGVLISALADMRSTVVGRWQASHDQKYRYGHDGRLRDIRGHKYGEDRYDALAPGKVGRLESGLIRAAAAGMGLLWLSSSPWSHSLSYSAALAGLFAAGWLWQKLRKPPPADPTGHGLAGALRASPAAPCLLAA